MSLIEGSFHDCKVSVTKEGERTCETLNVLREEGSSAIKVDSYDT